jgi:uncharacterized protein
MAMKSFGRSRFLRIYGVSLAITAIIIAAVGFGMGPAALVTLIILSIIEITFGLDCAVINAEVLRSMNAFWRRMFRTFGIFIAVFVMRLILPLSIVAITAGLSFTEVVQLVMKHPDEYAAHIHEANPYIAMLGGTFLLMVFLDFLLGQARQNPLSGIVRHLHVRGVRRYVQLIVVLCLMAAAVFSTEPVRQMPLFVAGMAGIIIYTVARGLAAFFAVRHTTHKPTADAVARGGFVAFLYLEMLDASFSFDSVIGAFAVTTNVLLIAAGLGIGAIWLRSATISMLQRGTLRHYPFLGLGANVAIGALGTLLLIEVNVPVPELMTGVLGLAIIIVAFLASVLHNQRAAKAGVSTHIALRNHRQ